NERYLNRKPMIFTTNKPLAAWGLVLHDPDLAEAIIDRVLERGRLVELRGPSYRTRHLKAVDLRSSAPEVGRISGKHRAEFPEPTNVMGSTILRLALLAQTTLRFQPHTEE